jgi:hypothetical protein
MQNPYLPQQAQAITNQVNNNLQQQQIPGINSGAIAAGGFGGSRQGIAQGLAIGQTNQALGNSLSNLYGNAYAQDQQLNAQRDIATMQNQTQRDLGFGNLGLGYTQAQNQYNLGQGNLALGNKQADQSYGLGMTQAQNQYNLGMGNLGLGQMQANQNFYTSQRGQDLQQAGLGANLINQGNTGLAAGGQGLYNLGLTEQNAPLNALQAYAQLLGPFTGLNGSTATTTPGASTAGSALGGALTAAQFWELLTKTQNTGG